jgi:hypothetical protein
MRIKSIVGLIGALYTGKSSPLWRQHLFIILKSHTKLPEYRLHMPSSITPIPGKNENDCDSAKRVIHVSN